LVMRGAGNHEVVARENGLADVTAHPGSSFRCFSAAYGAIGRQVDRVGIGSQQVWRHSAKDRWCTPWPTGSASGRHVDTGHVHFRDQLFGRDGAPMVVIRTCLVAVALGRAKAAEVGNVRVGIDD
jgi:hypothetical protein